MNDYKKLANEVGVLVAANENAITAGPRGPVVMQDVGDKKWSASTGRLVLPYFLMICYHT